MEKPTKTYLVSLLSVITLNFLITFRLITKSKTTNLLSSILGLDELS